jgi:hypothetical protein
MPRSFRALLPAEVRIRPDRDPNRPMLSWVCSASPEHSSSAVGSASRPIPSCAFCDPTRKKGRSALQGFPERSNLRDLAIPRTLVRFAAGTCPRALPTTEVSRNG